MPVRSPRGSFVDSANFAKKRINTLQGFGAFFVQSILFSHFLSNHIALFPSVRFVCRGVLGDIEVKVSFYVKKRTISQIIYLFTKHHQIKF